MAAATRAAAVSVSASVLVTTYEWPEALALVLGALILNHLNIGARYYG